MWNLIDELNCFAISPYKIIVLVIFHHLCYMSIAWLRKVLEFLFTFHYKPFLTISRSTEENIYGTLSFFMTIHLVKELDLDNFILMGLGNFCYMWIYWLRKCCLGEKYSFFITIHRVEGSGLLKFLKMFFFTFQYKPCLTIHICTEEHILQATFLSNSNLSN